VRAIRRFTVRVTLPEPLAALHGLMLNLRWSWHSPTADLFASIDPGAWAASGRDPIAMLSALPSARIAQLAADQEFLGRLAEAERDLRQYMSDPRWYAAAGPNGADGSGPAAIAYFSPEYGITAALPQYSGGLGILAGDHLKSASDLGVPLIGVGLLYRHGYFTQSLSADGWQAERYPAGDPNGLPFDLLRDTDGTAVRIAFWAGQLTRVLRAIRAAGTQAGLDPVVGGSAAAGVLHAALPADAPATAVAQFVTGLRAALDDDLPASGAEASPGVQAAAGAPAGAGAEEAGRSATGPRGSVVVLHAPPAVREAVDLWGPVPGVALMRAIKEQFDPEHRMAPGRFAGGI